MQNIKDFGFLSSEEFLSRGGVVSVDRLGITFKRQGKPALSWIVDFDTLARLDELRRDVLLRPRNSLKQNGLPDALISILVRFHLSDEGILLYRFDGDNYEYMSPQTVETALLNWGYVPYTGV